MGSRALLLLAPATLAERFLVNHFPKYGFQQAFKRKEEMLRVGVRNYSVHSSLERPNVPRLAETARISLTAQEAEEFAPKIQQVVDWFGQLQDVDLQSIEPAIRAASDKTTKSNQTDSVNPTEAGSRENLPLPEGVEKLFRWRPPTSLR